MFGSHKKQGREAGLATRNIFTSTSIGSSLFDFAKGFQPSEEFLRHPYVLAFSATTISLMMNMVFRGEKWPLTKKGEFMRAAVIEFSMSHPLYSQNSWLKLMDHAPGAPDFSQGKDHAEANFFATAGLISPASHDPLVMSAREAARNMPSGADLATGMMQITVKEFLLREFPLQPR